MRYRRAAKLILMLGKFLLDSSILIRIIRSDTALAQKLTELPQVFLVPTIVGELYYGAYKAANSPAELARVTALTQAITTLPYDYQTGVAYAHIKDELRRKGRPIPEADMWIAAAARQYSLTLIHRDQHFEEIASLLTEKW